MCAEKTQSPSPPSDEGGGFAEQRRRERKEKKLNPAENLHLPLPPLCKGRWRGEAVTEGLQRKINKCLLNILTVSPSALRAASSSEGSDLNTSSRINPLTLQGKYDIIKSVILYNK